ncbi:hypothetical protein AKJ16_DCAP17954 [Drosera capensis]
MTHLPCITPHHPPIPLFAPTTSTPIRPRVPSPPQKIPPIILISLPFPKKKKNLQRLTDFAHSPLITPPQPRLLGPGQRVKPPKNFPIGQSFNLRRRRIA